ncbi:MAG: YciI family protein [Anaerolineae bacterium]|nr:YciI family protein [Anaerolineae bacterium]MDQ7037278.1 YciI family protein [Anaerolineae bacterium]
MNQYMYTLQVTRLEMLLQAVRPEQVAEPTEWEQERVSEHFMYLQENTEKGVFCMVGLTANTDYSMFGMGVIRAKSHSEAWEIGKNDPAVINRVMRLDILPFSIAMVKKETII